MACKKKRGVNFCRKKGHRQYEITLRDTIGGGGFQDDYGFPSNPPIVLCAKSKTHARKQLKLPKGVEISKIARG